MDGYQQLVTDFAYWRVLRAGEMRGETAATRAWFAKDRRLREALTLRDLGYWAHFVGDGSQPLHASLHYDGWGDFPNPHGYTQARIHAAVRGRLRPRPCPCEAAIRAALRAPRDCGPTIQLCVSAYLAETLAQVEPLYQLWGQGASKGADPRGQAFAAARLGAGASELRDLIVKAWAESADAKVGYPAISVKAVEAGAPVPMGSLYGLD